MSNTRKKGVKKRKTRKRSHKHLIKGLNVEDVDKSCVALKPFEKEFEKTMAKNLNKSNNEYKNKIASQLLRKTTPSSMNPKKDFYNYINYNWLKKISLKEKQKYIVQVDDFRLAQDKVYKELDTLVLNYIKKERNELALNLNNFRKSIVKMNSKSDSKNIAKEKIKYIDDKRENRNNLWDFMGEINKDEMLSSSAPFSWTVNADEKKESEYCSCVYPHAFAILDIDVYFYEKGDKDDKNYNKNYIKQYKLYCKELFDTILGKQHGFNTDDIFEVEKKMIMTYDCKGVISPKKNVNYNKVSSAESKMKYNFDWEAFALALGFSEVPKYFITSSLHYLKCCSTLLLEEWHTEKWRAYWVWIYLRQICRLTEGWEKITYKFHGEFQRGQEKINYSDSVSSSLYLSVPFNTFLTNQYIKSHRNEKQMLYTQTMCEDLRIVYMRIIKRNKWMSSSTKRYALKKLKNITFHIGYMPKLREDPLLGYTTNLYDNMHKIHSWRHKKFIQLDGKKIVDDIPLMDWTQYPVKMAGNQAYIVNASYTPTKNSIFINLGYIQKPFIDLEARGIEYNLATLGFTIAHELSHALDDWGSKYNDKGVLFNWWSPKDGEIFKRMQKEVTSQYTEHAKRDGIYYDAAIGIGENMADISSMAICDEYLRDFQEKNNMLPAIRALSYEAFYTYYAFQMKQKLSVDALSAQLKTNPHALDKYRTNIPLSRSQIFRALFNIKKGDAMWWNNTNTIW